MSVIFVGNGINRCAGIVPGWDELFAEAVNVPSFQVRRSITPTMENEKNVKAIMKNVPAKKSGDIKRDIANYLHKKQKEAPANWDQRIHQKLLTCAPSTILTTNYDYFLEYAIDPNFKPGPASTKEILYSKGRYREAGGHRIYHIHGEISGPASICLGYEHYVGSTQYIRSELLKSTDKTKNHFHLADVLNHRDTAIPNRWYYHLFLDTVYILGFSLDAAEQDIWWLLNYRAKLKQEHPEWIKNQVVYLETDSPFDAMPSPEKRQELLDKIEAANLQERKNILLEEGKSLSDYWNKKQIIEQKRELLNTFGIVVKDCTKRPGPGGSDIVISDFVNRYEYALEIMKRGDEQCG